MYIIMFSRDRPGTYLPIILQILQKQITFKLGQIGVSSGLGKNFPRLLIFPL